MIKKIFTINNILSFTLFTTILVYNKVNDKAYSDIVTFMSIAAGFGITGLSIIATSAFSKRLYQIESKDDNSKTLLHILVKDFKNAIFYFTFTVILILFYKYLDLTSYLITFFGYTMDLIKGLSNIILYVTISAIVRFIFLVNIFGKFVIQTAK